MATKAINNVKLGVFVLAGLVFLVLLLYMIGKNRSFFGRSYILKARFENVQGLVSGNNVRVSGISSGTVKKITMINDTLIEVSMAIDQSMSRIIRKNAIASISTEGLVGNKVINISAGVGSAALAEEGDIIAVKKGIDTDEMLAKLANTNDDIAVITNELKSTVQRINSSKPFWDILNDRSIPENIRASLFKVHKVTEQAARITDDIHTIVADVKNGNGSIGALLKDSSFSTDLGKLLENAKNAGSRAEKLFIDMDSLVNNIKQGIESGKGTAYTLLNDTTASMKLKQILDNIEKGTDNFKQDMEALKHNILFRGYFRRLEKAKKKK